MSVSRHAFAVLFLISIEAAEDFYPPTRVCTNARCPHQLVTGSPRHLQAPERHPAVLYTLAHGAFNVYTTSLRCLACGSRYYLNYCRRDDAAQKTWRVYYSGLPTIVQSESHFLFDMKLCELFRAQTVHSHASFTAIARIYNAALASSSSRNPTNVQVSPLRMEHIVDLFNLVSLLKHHHEQQSCLHLPEAARTQVERLAPAMEERNHFIYRNNQEQWFHACDICRKMFAREGRDYMLSAAVTDGVSVRRFCCAVHNCPQPLPTYRSRFCPEHAAMESVCAVKDCSRSVRSGKQTCDAPQHAELEENYHTTGQSFALLRRRLLQTQNYHRGHAHFGRRRTHNEQLVVRPCGIILARGTFYGAESLSGVADFLIRVFPWRNSLPNVIFYDNNCQLHRYMAERPTLKRHFEGTALVVDVFHFKCKHSEADVYCSTHCNAMAYPQLYDAATQTWTFNSSACEQTNAWLNKYRGIVRAMLPVQYEFFLDEVIKERNRFLVSELENNNHRPHTIPASALVD
ncbi:hypothetical protein CALCODRAFT_427048 [Calocera cornea HHB12733]|uniref:CxC6 like cysteine cluster associated with KDZ domain-containing protein n=1 Tax=Calocera cornea HHB12733 TaxID=1353952 RepID=A0A165JJF6_9BASI|nr:hypothetical protein CALCODRAFT_427048 [Calocera cornea HHB12733]